MERIKRHDSSNWQRCQVSRGDGWGLYKMAVWHFVYQEWSSAQETSCSLWWLLIKDHCVVKFSMYSGLWKFPLQQLKCLLDSPSSNFWEVPFRPIRCFAIRFIVMIGTEFSVIAYLAVYTCLSCICLLRLKHLSEHNFNVTLALKTHLLLEWKERLWFPYCVCYIIIIML
jgi:hypothetical protein